MEHLLGVALVPLIPALRREACRLFAAGAPRVLDPSMGDGIFLAAAADRMAALAATPTRRELVARCLYGVDIDAAAVTAARRRLGAVASDAHLLQVDFLAPRCPVDGPFDLIVGNPPWGGWSRVLPPDQKRDLRSRFVLARGRIDPFALFLERATSLLEEGGRLAMVLPDYFLLKDYPAARLLVLDHYVIEEVARWGAVFDGVNLDACSLVATRRRSIPPRHRVRCLPEGPGGNNVITPQSRFRRTPGHTFNLSLDARDSALLARLRSRGTPLGDLLETHEGIHSGNIRSRLFVPPDGARRGLPGLIMRGSEVRAFVLSPAGWSVRYRTGVIDRAAGDYANLGRERWFRGPKILVRRTGDRVIAALDRSGLFASNNLFVALRRPGCPVSLDYLEGYLNSSLATWCFRADQPRVGRLFAELKLVHLNRLPVPVPESAAGRRAMSKASRLARSLRRPDGEGRGPMREALDDLISGLAGMSRSERARIATDHRR